MAGKGSGKTESIFTGSPTTGGLAGVQCKGKRTWPPKQLTTAEIDAEIAEAREFEPALTEYTIATAAPDDGALQEHVRKISQRHKEEGLFTVHIVGWAELTRRLTQHDTLVEKHYNFVGLTSVKADVAKVFQKTEQIAEQLQDISAQGGLTPASAATLVLARAEAIGQDISDALERDLASRYRKALQRLPFPEIHGIDEFSPLADEVLSGSLSKTSANLRRCVLLRAARRAALTGMTADAVRFVAGAQSIQGEESALPAEARILEAQGLVEEAIAKLRDDTTPEGRSTLLSMLERARGGEVGLSWLKEAGVTLADLTGGGIHTLAVIYLKKDFETARNILMEVSGSVLADCPYLLFLRSAVRLAALFPKPDRPLALMGYPLDVRTAHPIGTSAFIELELDGTLEDLHRVQPVLRGLGLIQAQRVAELLVTWCELIHPQKKAKAAERLHALMQAPATALPNLQFALAYDTGFDPAPIRSYLDTREKLVGWNDDDLRAGLVLCSHTDEAGEVALFVAKHRRRLQQLLGIEATAAIEVQALARGGDATSAQLVLDEQRNAISEEMVVILEAEVARASGEDSVVALRQAYETTKNVDTLRNLVAELIRRNDNKALAHFAEKLHAETRDPRDLLLTAKALAEAGEDAEFLRIIERNPSLSDQNSRIARRYAWKLFERGRMAEALAVTQRLQSEGRGDDRDFQLEIALAIETGAWETLAAPLNDLLASAEQHDGLALIRAAHIAHVTMQGSFLGLLGAAIGRSPDDPNVLLGAYTIILEEGLEEKKPEAQEWFRKALDLSGEDGPIRTFELKDLLSHQRAWTERTGRINEAITEGSLPLTIAAQGFHTTLAELLLGNLVGNWNQPDARKKSALPLFSGRRNPLQLGHCQTLAIDPSAAIVLGWLGLLPKVVEAYPKVVLPAATMGELFEAFSSIRKFQRSQIVRAKEVLSAIGRKGLKVHHSPSAARDALAGDVGASFVSLLRASEAVDGYVVQPAPLKRLGLNDEDMDVSPFAGRLIDVHCILDCLVEEGHIDEVTEETARRYLAVQDKRLANRPTINKDTPLFLDDLALHYLQTLNLLNPLLMYFANISIEESTEQRARGLKKSSEDSENVISVIGDVRKTIHASWKAGKLGFGPQYEPLLDSDEGKDDERRNSGFSTMHLLANLMHAEIVLADDRAFNKEAFAVDRSGHRAHVATTLDVLEDLRGRDILTDTEYPGARHKLRISGAVLMPVTEHEIVSAALRSKNKESAELRAVRESIGLARTARIPRFPGEIPWLAHLTLAIKNAIINVWKEESDTVRAARLASALLELRPRPSEWLEQWDGTAPPDWADGLEVAVVSALVLPFEFEDEAILQAYHEWLESSILAPMRELRPELYQDVVEKSRALILSQPRDEGNDIE